MICDFAQTYHVTDYRALPVRTTAVLLFGLGENSRIVRKITGQRYSFEQLMIAEAVDRLSILAWQNTKDAQHGRNKPKMISAMMLEEKKESEVVGFSTAEEFQSQWKAYTDK